MAERYQEITETEEDEAGNRSPDRKTPVDTGKTVHGGRKKLPFFKTKKRGPNRFLVDDQWSRMEQFFQANIVSSDVRMSSCPIFESQVCPAVQL